MPFVFYSYIDNYSKHLPCIWYLHKFSKFAITFIFLFFQYAIYCVVNPKNSSCLITKYATYLLPPAKCITTSRNHCLTLNVNAYCICCFTCFLRQFIYELILLIQQFAIIDLSITFYLQGELWLWSCLLHCRRGSSKFGVATFISVLSHIVSSNVF